LHSGDVGTWDADGYTYLIERTKNGCPENRNLLRGRRVNMYVNWRSSVAVSTTSAAAVAGGRTEDPLTKRASKRPEGGR
jgi:acyl-CoA synthetase (AMP-forming)/AMP-acid ligase II